MVNPLALCIEVLADVEVDKAKVRLSLTRRREEAVWGPEVRAVDGGQRSLPVVAMSELAGLKVQFGGGDWEQGRCPECGWTPSLLVTTFASEGPTSATSDLEGHSVIETGPPVRHVFGGCLSTRAWLKSRRLRRAANFSNMA